VIPVALLSPPGPAIVIPSATATERVLWLAAVDRCLRPTPTDDAVTRAAERALRGAINRHGPALYALTRVSDRRESAWLVALLASVHAEVPDAVALRAALVLWAAVEVWTDAPDGRWSTLADVASTLAVSLDAALGCGGAATGRVASKLRAVMRGAR